MLSEASAAQEPPSDEVSDNRRRQSGRQRTSTDGLSQASRAAALADSEATWLRDEEAAGFKSGRIALAMTQCHQFGIRL
jgi:hypothetical protein